jgi:hypothetical protein
MQKKGKSGFYKTLGSDRSFQISELQSQPKEIQLFKIMRVGTSLKFLRKDFFVEEAFSCY